MFIPNIDLKSFEEMLQEWSDWWYDLGDWEVAALEVTFEAAAAVGTLRVPEIKGEDMRLFFSPNPPKEGVGLAS